MLKKFLKQITFSSQEDFALNYEVAIPNNFNFAYDVVDAWAEKEPKKKAMLWTNDEGKRFDFTFADFKKFSDMTASFFARLGIKKGDTVMLILKRRFEFWFSMLGLHKLGAIAIPATHLLTEKDIVGAIAIPATHLLTEKDIVYRNNAADIKMIVACGDKNIIEHVNRAKPDSPSLEHTVSIGPIVPEGWEDFHKGINDAPVFIRPEHVNNNDDISLIYFTSGTTANPKMAAHDFLYPLGHIITGKYWHNLDENSLHLTISDTGWGKAVWGKLYGQWIAGANIFVYDHEKFTPKEILKAIEKYKITSFCAPPTVFRFLIREDILNTDLSSLKWCTIAGEALNPAVYDTFYEMTGIKLREGFGQTETTLTVVTLPWVEPKPGSMGLANPQYDVDIINSEGKSCEVGEHGQIVIRTNKKKPLGLFKEYYKDKEKTLSVWHDDIYYTGDIAWRDKDGYFWFVGRADDIIKSSGYRISPFEVESVLMTHKAIVECAVTAAPDIKMLIKMSLLKIFKNM